MCETTNVYLHCTYYFTGVVGIWCDRGVPPMATAHSDRQYVTQNEEKWSPLEILVHHGGLLTARQTSCIDSWDRGNADRGE